MNAAVRSKWKKWIFPACALCLLAGVGIFLALRDALPQGTVLQPNLENHEFYKTCYSIFRELYRANRESMYALQDNL